VFVEANGLPQNSDPRAERPRRESTFSAPQLLLKQGWSVEKERFQARIVIPEDLGQGVLCSQSYVSVCASEGEESLLEAACLSWNSLLAVYFLLLTSGRFSAYRPETLVKELERVPIPEPQPKLLDGLRSVEDIDQRVRDAFDFKDAEWVLVEDLFNVTLPDFKGGSGSPGRQRTQRRNESTEEPELRSYCEYFIRVLKAGFGQDKNIAATVFHETREDLLPYRLIAFELDKPTTEQLHIEPLDSPALLSELQRLNKTWLGRNKTESGSIFHRRVARIYDYHGGIPTIFVLKPDACRYWTRSMGLHDADEVAADFAHWQAATSVEQADQ
jgi:hypothetical protein